MIRIVELEEHDIAHLAEVLMAFETFRVLAGAGASEDLDAGGIAALLDPHVRKLKQVYENLNAASDAGHFKPGGAE